MRIVITGGAGFLGQRLARAILGRGSLTDARGDERPVREVVLVDVLPARSVADARLRVVAGDLADPAVAAAAITPDTDSVFHLAAVVSGQAEADYDLGMSVNLDATRRLLDCCRALPAPPKFVFASSIAVFGGRLPDPVPDDAPLTPHSSYGTQKVIGELLVADLSRRGALDGRSLRLPTVTVRPGLPNRAASSFASGIVREPLAGVEAICPVAPGTRMWVQSPAAVIENLLTGHEAPAAALAASRSISVPGISVAVGDMVAALRDVAGDAVADRVRWQLDPAVDRIVSTWPAALTAEHGHALGMRADRDFAAIVRSYIGDLAAGAA